jgi:tetrahydromethanopterin S-methyltransferase subunit G
MRKFLKELWTRTRNVGESIGFFFLSLGLLVLLTHFALLLLGLQIKSDFLISVWLGLFSVGLGFIAIGLSEKADKKYTEILERLDENIVKLLEGQDKIVTPRPAALVIKTFAPEVIVEHKSKESAQKRLDEDTKRVGYVRGELYQLEDGSWGIAWAIGVGGGTVKPTGTLRTRLIK